MLGGERTVEMGKIRLHSKWQRTLEMEAPATTISRYEFSIADRLMPSHEQFNCLCARPNNYGLAVPGPNVNALE